MTRCFMTSETTARRSFEATSHLRDFGLLRLDHVFGELLHLGILAERNGGLGHVDGRLMVRDHAFHEIDIALPE